MALGDVGKAAGPGSAGDGRSIHLDDGDDSGLVPAIPAATMVVLRDAPDGGAPQLLMVRRSAKMAFAAGAAVFPGGRIDTDDAETAAQFLLGAALAPDDAVARVAAIRETLEETGLPIGLDRDHSADVLTELRRRLLAGERFSTLLGESGARIDPHQLEGFSRWRPNFAHSRVFDTRFYITRAPADLPVLSVEAGENSSLFWIEPATALAQAADKQLHIIFPTRRNLERLAQFADFESIRASLRQFPPRRIVPFIAQLGGVDHLCIRDDCGYPVTSEPVATALTG